MSVKIYEAMRVPIGNLNTFLGIATEATLVPGEAWFRDWTADIKPPEETPPEWIRGRPEREETWIRLRKVRQLIQRLREGYRGLLSIENGLNVWLHDDGKAYVIPWGDWACVAFRTMTPPDWAEDYSYWNNTDPPNWIPYEEWLARGETWNDVCLGGDKWEATRLNHVIVSLQDGSTMHRIESRMGGADIERWRDAWLLENKKR